MEEESNTSHQRRLPSSNNSAGSIYMVEDLQFRVSGCFCRPRGGEENFSRLRSMSVGLDRCPLVVFLMYLLCYKDN